MAEWNFRSASNQLTKAHGVGTLGENLCQCEHGRILGGGSSVLVQSKRPPNSNHNNINTRAELKIYDKILAELIHEVFGDAEVTSSCHETWDINYDFSIQGVMTDPDGRPLEDMYLNAWQGNRLDSGSDRTDAKGVFRIKVPEGTFTLDVHAGSPRRCVGWFDGKRGITSYRNEAAEVVVDGVSVSGIAIVSPMQPAELPPCRENSSFKFTIQGVIKGPDGRPLEDVLLWACQGARHNSGSGTTNDKGEFHISVPEGTFTLDVYVGVPRRRVWHDGEKGITDNRIDAGQVVVKGESVTGIEIVFPKPPDDLPITR